MLVRPKDEYIGWNNLIGSYFFDKSPDQKVFLYMTKPDLINYYRKNHRDAGHDSDIWDSFVRAVRAELNCNCIDDPRHVGRSPMIENVNRLYRLSCLRTWPQNWPVSKYPLYLSILVLLVIAKAETEAANTDSDVRQVIQNFFDGNELPYEENFLKQLCTTQVGNNNEVDGGYWKKLKEWSYNYGRGEFAFVFPNVGQRYVGVIRDQCLLSRDAKLKLPEFYVAARLNHCTDYPLLYLRGKMLDPRFRGYFSQSMLTAVRGNDWESVVSIVYNHFKNEWDGEGRQRDGGASRRRCIPCFLCVEFPQNGGMSVNYRLFSDDNESLSFNGQTLNFMYGWSESFQQCPDDRGTRFRFNLEERDFYILVQTNRDTTFFYATIKEVYPGERLYLLAPRDSNPLPGAVRLDGYCNGPWAVFSYVVPNVQEEIPAVLRDLNSQTPASITFENGAKTGRGYLPTLLPEIVDPLCHHLRLVGEDETEYTLQPVSGLEDGHWVIEGGLAPGNYRVLDSDDDQRSATLSVVKGDRGIVVDFVKLDCYGKVLTDDADCYFTNNSVVGFREFDDYAYPNYEQYPNQNEIYLCQENNHTIRDNDTGFQPTFGDYLVDWLYCEGKVSRNRFVKTFYSYQQAYFRQNPKAWRTFNINVKSVIKWLQYQGFIDIDKNGNLVACEPAYICLPVGTTHCNVVHLVGCRSLCQIEELQRLTSTDSNCSFHYNQVRDEYMKARLTPTLIYLEVKGRAENNFGLDYLGERYSVDLLIRKPDINFIRKIREFVPSMEGFSEQLQWLPVRNSVYGCFDYVSSLYDPQTLSYSDEDGISSLLQQVVDEGPKLILVKKTVYEYTPLLVRVNNGEQEFCEIADESMGKLFVIYLNSHANRNGLVQHSCINPISQNGGNNRLSYVGVMKKTHLPLIWEKLLNMMSVEIPFVCNTRFPECPYKETDQVLQGGAIRRVAQDCTHSWENRCPVRYYLYNADHELFNRHMLKTLFEDKLHFNILNHSIIQ